jgi:hypothetical protein
MTALHAKMPRHGVANPRHSPSHGFGLSLGTGRFGVPFGLGGKTLGL